MQNFISLQIEVHLAVIKPWVSNNDRNFDSSEMFEMSA
jgi:hypothetical protein